MSRWWLGIQASVCVVALVGCASGDDVSSESAYSEGESDFGSSDPAAVRSVLAGKARRSPSEEVTLGEACLRLGDKERAATAFHAARGVSADQDVECRALCGLGEVALLKRNSYEARTYFEQAQNVAPGADERDQALVGRARAAVLSGQWEEARSLRQQVARGDVPGAFELDAQLRDVPERPSGMNSTSLVRATKPETSTFARPSSETPKTSGAKALSRRPKGRGIAPPAVFDRSVWNADPIRRSGNPDPMGTIRRITVHHTADKVGPPGPSFADNTERVRAIQNAHQDDEHWADIGYHFIIDQQGRTFEGRELIYQGAHAGTPDANANNVGIALIGDCRKNPPTAAQRKAFTDLVTWLQKEYSVSPNRIYGHGECLKLHDPKRGTDCPGRYLQEVVEAVRKSLGATTAPAPKPVTKAPPKKPVASKPAPKPAPKGTRSKPRG